jgi:hypothetical protein
VVTPFRAVPADDSALSVAGNAVLIALVVLAFVAVFPLVGLLLGRAIAAREARGGSAARGRALRLNAIRTQLFLPCVIGTIIVVLTAVHLVQRQPINAGTWALIFDGAILGPGSAGAIVLLSRRISELRRDFAPSEVPPRPSARSRVLTWTLVIIALAATASTEFIPSGHPVHGSLPRGLALTLAIALPALLIGGFVAIIVWRLRGGRIERHRPVVFGAICAFCVLASAATWWLHLA